VPQTVFTDKYAAGVLLVLGGGLLLLLAWVFHFFPWW
jgi:hypothetical protein